MPTPLYGDEPKFDDDQDPVEDDAIELLTDDHDTVKQLFDDYDCLVDSQAGANEREAVARHICTLLTVHATIEEEIFYPAASEVLDHPELVDEALDEHAQAKQLIAEIEATSAEGAGYDDLVRKLSDAIHQHVKEEEEVLFVRAISAGLDAEDIGRRLSDRREELLADLEME